MIPSRVFDAHFHIIDPAHPLVANQGYLPDAFPAGAYLAATTELRVTGGAVVSGSFQGFDTGYLETALAALGPGFVGVANVPMDADAAELRRLDALGVRAVRFNLYRGSSMDLSDVERLGRLAHDVVGWHSEFYLDAAHLPELAPTLASLPQVSIDHFGMADDPSDTLLRLVGDGAVVKATGLGRIGVADPAALARRILAANPQGLVFGTDLPSTRAKVPYTHADAEAIAAWVGEEHAEAVFHDNAARLYRIAG